MNILLKGIGCFPLINACIKDPILYMYKLFTVSLVGLVTVQYTLADPVPSKCNRNVSSLFQEYKIKHFLVRDSCSSYITKLLIPSSPNTTPLSHAKKLMNHVPLPHAKWAPPPKYIICSAASELYITFGTIKLKFCECSANKPFPHCLCAEPLCE